MIELKETKVFDIRFSEVDSMNVVWHGSYPLYFEDAREAFGKNMDWNICVSLIMAILPHWSS